MIRYLVMDVDGTLTDGKIYMGRHGEICKAFHARDGYGVRNMLPPAGIVPVIMTGRKSKIVGRRCRELGIGKVYQGVSDKAEKLRLLTDDLSTVAFIGDDLNDVGGMELIRAAGGTTGCPRDAAKQVRALADFASEYGGGDGAVRDFIEWILERNAAERS